jgi:hypothetical protein
MPKANFTCDGMTSQYETYPASDNEHGFPFDPMLAGPGTIEANFTLAANGVCNEGTLEFGQQCDG